MRKPKPFKKESITVAFAIEKLRERVGIEIASVNEVSATERLITESNLHRPGLALAGFVELFTYQRVQILGNTENQYLQHLSPEARLTAFDHLLQFDIPCLFLTENNTLDDAQVQRATDRGIPIFRTPMPTTEFMALHRDFLRDQFALQLTVHASMVDVYGVGLVIMGESGIGKSEVALDLVERGHRLVADDVVVLTKNEENVLMAAGTDVAQHFMEIRGLGIVDVKAMFGVRAIRYQKRAEVVVGLEIWDPEQTYTRVGLSKETETFMGVSLPYVRLPIIPGKNITVICEVIAMNYLLRHYGYDAATVFKERLSQRIREKKGMAARRGIEYFEHDYE